MAYGLDIGSGVLAGAGDDDPPTAEPLIAVPVAESADRSPADLLTIEVGTTTYAVGSDATAVADATDATPRELFPAASAADDVARPALGALVEAVAPATAGERGCYTTAGPVLGPETPREPHRAAVESVLSERSDEPIPIDRGFAVVYDQLAADNYTGLGICLGRRTTSVALAYYGVPAMAFSLPIGGRWVVDRAAAETTRSPAEVETALAEFALDPEETTGAVEEALARAYDALAVEVVVAIQGEAPEHALHRGLAVPVAIGGDRAAAGLEYLFGARLDAAAIPFSIRGARLAADPGESAARGALAELADAGVSERTALADEVAALGTDLEGVSERIEGVADDVAGNGERLGTLDGRVAALEDEVDGLAARVDAFEADFTERIDALERDEEPPSGRRSRRADDQPRGPARSLPSRPAVAARGSSPARPSGSRVRPASASARSSSVSCCSPPASS